MSVIRYFSYLAGLRLFKEELNSVLFQDSKTIGDYILGEHLSEQTVLNRNS